MFGIVLALGASAGWGVADFMGGVLSRRHPLFAVIVISQLAGLVATSSILIARGAAFPGIERIWPALGGGVLSAVALASFYRALAVGSMSVVAPILSTSAAVPVLVGIARGERPDPIQSVGLLLALGGVVLASREHSEGAHGPGFRRGVVLALVAAAVVGVQLVAIADGATHDPYWTVWSFRAVGLATVLLAALVLRRPLTVAPAAIPAIAATGILDVASNIAFAVATTLTLLSLSAVLSSLYPVITVALAQHRLSERLAPVQIAGVALALGGVACITAG
jgi:drug/metabolite transporter (DMT)-like permease